VLILPTAAFRAKLALHYTNRKHLPNHPLSVILNATGGSKNNKRKGSAAMPDDNQNQPVDPSPENNLKDGALPPLADPVIAATFTNVEQAGLAAESLFGAILAEDKLKIGKIVSLIPQRHHSMTGERGTRIDLEAWSDSNQVIIAEVQIFGDTSMPQRNLLAGSRIITETSHAGTNTRQMARNMPFVVVINILGKNIRPGKKTNKDIVQPAKIMYTKKPFEVAAGQFSIYNGSNQPAVTRLSTLSGAGGNSG
jgi:hypothetical protein